MATIRKCDRCGLEIKNEEFYGLPVFHIGNPQIDEKTPEKILEYHINCLPTPTLQQPKSLGKWGAELYKWTDPKRLIPIIAGVFILIIILKFAV